MSGRSTPDYDPVKIVSGGSTRGLTRQKRLDPVIYIYKIKKEEEEEESRTMKNLETEKVRIENQRK